jgi:pectate lyase
MNDLATPCTQDGDVMSVHGVGGKTPDDFSTRDLWLHHCDLHDGGDGLFDIRGASKVTLSWNHFHHHKKAILAWTDANQDPTPEMRVTFHHNFFDRITLRGPQFLCGRAHYVNNYQFEWYEYGASSLGGAQVLSENNIYEAIPGLLYKNGDPNPCGDDDSWHPVRKEGFVVDWDSDGKGYARSVGDLKLNDAIVQENEPGKVFDPYADYAYAADVADDALRQRIQTEAGPRTGYCH